MLKATLALQGWRWGAGVGNTASFCSKMYHYPGFDRFWGFGKNAAFFFWYSFSIPMEKKHDSWEWWCLFSFLFLFSCIFSLFLSPFFWHPYWNVQYFVQCFPNFFLLSIRDNGQRKDDLTEDGLPPTTRNAQARSAGEDASLCRWGSPDHQMKVEVQRGLVPPWVPETDHLGGCLGIKQRRFFSTFLRGWSGRLASWQVFWETQWFLCLWWHCLRSVWSLTWVERLGTSCARQLVWWVTV